MTDPAEPLAADNPFAQPSTLPYGLPPLDRITPAHLLPAVRAGLAEQVQEWEAIATEQEPATVANTLDALERSGQLLSRVLTVHYSLVSSVVDDEVNAADAEISPLLAAHADRLHLDRRIFARLEELKGRAEEMDLGPEQARLLERTHLAFVRAGAQLDEASRTRLQELNQELSRLSSTFRSRLIEGANAAALHVTDPARLAGLSDDARAAAAAAARSRDLDGYLLTLVLPTQQPALASLEERAVREQLHRASITRGTGEHDTTDLVSAMTALRAERAGLLGFADHASYVIADQTAGEAEVAEDMLRSLIPATVANARREAAELERLLHEDGLAGPLQPWDWSFYAAKRVQQEHGIDMAFVSEHLPLERVLVDGVMAAASDLYGISFERRDDLPTYHPDVVTFEVFDADGSGIGLVQVDPYARDSKRGGAWMTTLSDQSRLLDSAPVITMTLNIPRPPDGQPALLTVDEVLTAFHEFGHVLHGLFSDVTYPRFSGTSVPRDFVEFPSQVNEMWAFDEQIAARYCRHHETDEALDPAIVAGLRDAIHDGQGFATAEYLAAALLDLAWHRLPPGHTVAAHDVELFEREALIAAGIRLREIPPRYRSTYFSHIFAGGYSAGYYSYIWSEVLDAEMVAWFGEHGGLQRRNGDLFRRKLLSRGGSVDPMAAFEDVRGRPPTITPLLERRGLVAADT